MTSATADIVIVGAGLSGLSCARRLAKAGLPFTLLEAADGIGGRIRTDEVDGFRLDRGFQVFLPAYPAAKRLLDYEALDLRPFYRGADVFYGGRFNRLSDPLHHPVQALRRFKDKLVPWRDKWFTLLLRKEIFTLKEVPRKTKEQPTEQFLLDYGFSPVFTERFFRPFFGGLFTERELRTSSRMFLFMFAMCDRGGTWIPAKGMQAIPDQLAASLPPGSIRLNSPVLSVAPGEITLGSGEVVKDRHIIVAASEEMAARLLPHTGPTRAPSSRSLTTMYFTTGEDLPASPILCLDGEGRGPVNHACVLTNISPALAPPGQRLITCNILGAPSSAQLESVVREQMTSWFGDSVARWRHLRTYQIRNAQPESRQLKVGDTDPDPVVAPGLYRCGDYCEDASINGALLSGERAAKAVIAAVHAARNG